MSSRKQADMARKRRHEDAICCYQRKVENAYIDARRWLEDELRAIDNLYWKELSQLPIIIKTKWGVLFG